MPRLSAEMKAHLRGAPVAALASDRPSPVRRAVRTADPWAGLTPRAGVDRTALALAAIAVFRYRFAGEEELVIGHQQADDPGRVLLVRLSLHGLESVGELLADAADAHAVAVGLGPVDVSDVESFRAGDGERQVPACHAVLITGSGPLPDIALADVALLVNGDEFAVATTAGQFSVDFAAGFAPHFAHLLTTLATDPGRTLDTVSLLAREERDAVLAGWTDIVEDTPGPYLHHLVADHARRTPDATALVSGDDRLSYAELDSSANRLANYLSGLGVRAGSRVGLCVDRGATHLLAQLAAFKLGAAAVLLDADYPAERLSFMLANSATDIVLTADGLSAGVTGPGTVVRLDAETATWRACSPVAPDTDAVTDDTVCHIAYASAATGLPMGVQLRHGPLRALVHTVRRLAGIGAESRGSWLVPAGLGLIQVDCLPVLAAGGEVHLPAVAEAATPQRLRDWLTDRRITHALVLTAMAERLWELPWPADGALRNLRVAGERPRTWPPAELPFQVLNLYGDAEATVVAACDLTTIARSLTDDQRAAHRPPIGRPVPSVRTYVLDAGLGPVPVGALGELYVSGPGLSAGYLNRPEITTAAFGENPIAGDPWPVLYRTGDVARYWPDGTIEVVGRSEHDVRLQGYRTAFADADAGARGAERFLVHPDQPPSGTWSATAASMFRDRMLSSDSLFPCVFGVDAVRRASLRYTFVPQGAFRGLWLAEALKSFVDIAPALGRRTSLVAFFEPAAGLSTHDDYREHFWQLLSELHGYDDRPWPADIATDPDNSRWEFSFHGMPLFVVANTPTHEQRQSRNFPYFLVTFQPRFVFDDLGEDTQQGANARKIIRARLHEYDAVPPAPVLDGFGKPDSREWVQYFLSDDNHPAEAERAVRCPFVSRVNHDSNDENADEVSGNDRYDAVIQ
jgi:amino acid adenylation domain-containing protein